MPNDQSIGEFEDNSIKVEGWFKKLIFCLLSYRICTPLLYLSIPKKKKIDIYVPFGMTVIILFLVMLVYPKFPALFGNEGIVTLGNSYISFLAGFFITALAAIMSFNSRILDSSTSGGDASVLSFQNGKWYKISPISRRRVLSFLFGYLTFLSFSVLIITFIIKIIVSMIDVQQIHSLYMLMKLIFLGFYLFGIFSIFNISFYGLFYLVERIHRD